MEISDIKQQLTLAPASPSIKRRVLARGFASCPKENELGRFGGVSNLWNAIREWGARGLGFSSPSPTQIEPTTWTPIKMDSIKVIEDGLSSC